MGKKYTPSGYQIIDLGEIRGGEVRTITKGENPDVDVLIDIANSGRLLSKPILLKFKEPDYADDTMCGFAAAKEVSKSLVLWIANIGMLEITCKEDSIEYNYSEL